MHTRLLLGLVVESRLDCSQALTTQLRSAHFLLISDVTPWVALGAVYILQPCSIFTRGLIELPQLLNTCCFSSFVSSGALGYKKIKKSPHVVKQNQCLAEPKKQNEHSWDCLTVFFWNVFDFSTLVQNTKYGYMHATVKTGTVFLLHDKQRVFVSSTKSMTIWKRSEAWKEHWRYCNLFIRKHLPPNLTGW